MNIVFMYLDKVGSLCRSHLLALVVVAYALAATCPGPGLAAKEMRLNKPTGTTAFSVTVPMCLLATLLFCAGVNSSIQGVVHVLRRPLVVFAGVVANVLVPVACLIGLASALRFWHSYHEAQDLLLGLSVVAAMPIAASSTAWAHSQNGHLPLSLGLVIISTLLSPLSTPWLLKTIVPLADANLSIALPQGHETGFLLATCVVAPAAAGLCLQIALPAQITSRVKRSLQILSPLALLSLCYIHASTALPQLLIHPDWDFLACVMLSAFALSLCGFASGWLLSRALRVDRPQTLSLAYGLGMNNNGGGLVLASHLLPGCSGAVISVLMYNLVQHLVAGGVSVLFSGRLTLARSRHGNDDRTSDNEHSAEAVHPGQ